MTRKERMRDIDLRIEELRGERRRLESEDAKEFQKAHRNNIGRCFITPNGEYVVITDVPRTKIGREHIVFNQYQFPAFVISLAKALDENHFSDAPGEPFFYDTAFSRDGVSFGNDPVFNERPWDEITPKEFRDAFIACIELIWSPLSDILFPEEDGEKT